ncbi:MAG TPA: 4-deoxy-4-formamido-L-arabinose-phosphoundecaprenol deformylase [Burkholderiales bacterium]|nr:4-deoxy-4-formamido-L-arabinose-phosphoundecaprenol deformylase [Burkholderiales bacterium]
MKLALKIDVQTLRGTRQGVPRLIELLQKHNASASFFFCVGPDHTGRAVKQLWRANLLKYYGMPSMLYGTVLPGPDIGKQCSDIMSKARAAGNEIGLQAYDAAAWCNHAAQSDAAWCEKQMRLGYERFAEIFGEPPKTRAAAGWQMNLHSYRLTQRMGFHYCSDTRGRGPFIPIYHGEIIACPQLPTTLPTVNEAIKSAGLDACAEHILNLSTDSPPTGHLYTLRAELEGMRLAPVFERLLHGWRAQGYELVSAGEIYASLEIGRLPRHEVELGHWPGTPSMIMLQAKEFLAG